jgi:hypothetical protein
MASEPTPGTRTPHFPGGRVKLPRLDPDRHHAGTQVAFVETAFRPVDTHVQTSTKPAGNFQSYYTYESLFEDAPEQLEEDAGEDPYVVLGLKHSATWPQISAAHRRLAKEFHPDRFATQPEDVREAAENEIKRINLAYSELRRLADLGQIDGSPHRA